MPINETELENLRHELSTGTPLNFTMLGRVFGEELWQLLVISLLGAEIHSDKIEIVVKGK